MYTNKPMARTSQNNLFCYSYLQYDSTLSIERQNCMIDNEMIEEKIGEVLGLEMAAQKAVEQLVSKGLLDKSEIKQQVEEIRKEAHNHQTQLRIM
jgi:hypothetical protein